MGGGFVVLCVKAKFVIGPTLLVVKSLWYTFLYNFTIAIWIGLAGMFMIDIYSRLKKINMVHFWDYLSDKYSEGGTGVIIGSGVIGGTITAVFLFDGTWLGAVKSMMAIAGTFMSIIGGIVAKDIYTYAKPKIIKYVKTKLYGKKRKDTNKRAA